jgi:hypothetical protein
MGDDNGDGLWVPSWLPGRYARYIGARRHEDGAAGRRWPVVAIIVAALAAAVAIPLAGMWASPRPSGAIPPIRVPTGNPAAPSPSDSPSPVLSPSASPSSPTGTPSRAAPRPSPPRPPIVPVTYEAEAPGNDLEGSAFVDDYPNASGGQIVRNIGRWKGMGPAGSLRFTNVTAPVTGSYVLTFFYVHLDNDPVRSAVITVSGSAPVEVTVNGTDRCCSTARLRITLLQGRNTITFSQPDGHAPSLDKIVISAT